jgi:glycine/D-amino acid oxidase-like deaminating enzyme
MPADDTNFARLSDASTKMTSGVQPWSGLSINYSYFYSRNNQSQLMKVAVIGAGIWGSSTALALQRQGHEVILIDMWGPGNVRSGSGGASRIIRLGYGPDQIYIDLTARSFFCWTDILGDAIHEHYEETGLLWLFSEENADYVMASQNRMAALGYELLELNLSRAIAKYPQISFKGISRVFYEPKAGILAANKCCEYITKVFKRQGGRYLTAMATVLEEESDHIQLNGKTFHCDRFVFATGPWTRKLFPSVLSACTQVSKQEVYHFAVPPEKMTLLDSTRFPAWLDYDRESPLYYGMPMHLGKGFKIAYDDRSVLFDPDADDRVIDQQRLNQARIFLAQRFPDLAGAPVTYTEVCQYDNSLDGHFIIDQHPRNPKFILLCGSSGHGFKMGPAIGELVANHLTTGHSLPKEFSVSRFTKPIAKQSQFLPHRN